MKRSKEWWMGRLANEAEVPIGASSGLAASVPVSESASGCMVVPTLKDQLARFLGYRFEHGEEPDGHEELSAGWAKTTTRLQFSLAGRIRLLFSGRLKIETSHYANTPIDRMKSRVDLRMYAPWERD